VKKLIRLLAVLVVLLICAGAGAYIYLQQQFRIPHSSGAGPVIIEIPRGSHTQDVLRLLKEHNLIDSENVALGYVMLSGLRGKLKAGEYLFDMPMTVGDVVDKIASGKIYLHKFTVPEGLTVSDTATRWEEQGFGSAEDFRNAAMKSVSLIHDLDKTADSLEGYLFPETYYFPIRTTPAQAIEAMVARFHEVITKLHQHVPQEQWPANLRQAVILASIVESEAAHDDERTLIASVYENRLKKNMLLQCDTTVIYALALEHRYRGTLTLKDLKFDSGYNTYVYPGLPPGPIMNPGYDSLLAAFQPASTKYLYFVRTTDRHHTFSETLAAHNKAVAAYRAMRH